MSAHRWYQPVPGWSEHAYVQPHAEDDAESVKSVCGHATTQRINVDSGSEQPSGTGCPFCWQGIEEASQ